MKMKNKSTEGITLVALVITVVVLLILAGVSLNLVFGNNGIIKKATDAAQKSKEAQRQTEEQLANLAELIDNNIDSVDGYKATEGVNIPKIYNQGSNTGLIPIKYKDGNWVVCSEDDPEWYNYLSSDPIWANAMLSDGKYKVGEVEVGQVVQNDELGSMFVWIPRYAYSINQYKTAINGTDGTTQNIIKVEFLKGNTNEGSSGKKYPSDYDADNVAEGTATPMIVQPAFKFGDVNLKGIWVAKFEASMQEANNNTTTNNDVSNKTVKIVPNAETWRYITEGNIFKTCLNMKSNSIYQLPSSSNTHQMKNSEWGAIAYLAASQYGKIPTINNSNIYYKEDEKDKYHSYSAGSGQTVGGDYETYTSQSTTGNVTGVYDMNGGAWEYVAAYWDNGNNSLKTYGSTDIFPNNILNPAYEIYFDKYEVSTDEKTNGSTVWAAKTTAANLRLAQMAMDRVKLMKTTKGDGMYEAIKEFSYYGRYSQTYSSYAAYEYTNWLKATYDSEGNATSANDDTIKYTNGLYGDYALVGNPAQPFLLRGGSWWDGAAAGVFASHGSRGDAGDGARFPPSVGFVAPL